MKKILGLGNALTDILLQVSEDDLRELGFPKGSMNLISREQAEQIQYRFLSVRKRGRRFCLQHDQLHRLTRR